jgi:AcrR family transcriptional regulator
MGQIATEKRRGRPPLRSDAETRRIMIEAASQEFQANGYAATCMNDVAQRAGVSTKTMYRLIPTKADLLKSVVSERIGRFMLEIDADALDALPLTEALERMLIAYGTLTLSEEGIAMLRLVLGERDRFPGIAATFFDVAIERTSKAMAGWLRHQCERGLIKLEDAHVSAGMLRGMMIMEPQRAVMLGQGPIPDTEEIAARAKYCARLFLDGCRLAHPSEGSRAAITNPTHRESHRRHRSRSFSRRNKPACAELDVQNDG